MMLLVVGMALAWAGTASACPSCKEALSGGQGDIVKGYFYSILFMMSMPFTMIGAFSGYMWYEVRKARAKSTAPPEGQTPRE